MAIAWEAPGILLDARPYAEADAVAAVFTEAHGIHRGLVRGGLSRGKVAIWQAGNLVQMAWNARLADQLGNLTGELVHPAAALAMQDPLQLAMLRALCAITEGALPERVAHPALFGEALRLIAHLSEGAALLPDLVRYEVALLAELGFGLDLRRCAISNQAAGLAWVSPRTGRAVTEAALPDAWRGRVLRLPGFLVGGNFAGPADWQDGLALTGHFLARDAFGQTNRPLPPARIMLADRVAALAGTA